MFRSALLVSIGVVVTAFMSVCAFLFPRLSPGENKAHRIANLWARMLLGLSGIRVEVTGRENVLKRRPQIFMANHQSDFDILVLLAHLPGQFRWIVKKELFKIPVFGEAMRNAGYIEIDRQNHAKAMQSLEQAAQKIREGKSVVTFPEGTRSRDATIRPFKQGLFHLAIRAGVPIVPIAIVGAHEIMPKRSLRVNPGKITVVIDQPVDVSGYTIETRGELIERVRGIIVRNYEKVRAQTLDDRGKDAPVTWPEAVILGIVQGLTEPLPVSSSAHLVIVPALIPGFHQPGVAFDVLLHLGTLLAVVFFLRREILCLCAALLPRRAPGGDPAADAERSAYRRLALWILVATVLTGAIGLLLQDRIERLFASAVTAAWMLWITGALLFLSDRVKGNRRRMAEMSLLDGIVIGLAQTVALVPGISRSGATIAFGIFRGLERDTAARFSFLISIPAIGGAAILKAAELAQTPAADLPALAAGFLAAAVSGFLALKLLFALLRRTGLTPFACYCWAAGAAFLLLL